MRRRNKKLIPKHQEFVDKYVCSYYEPNKLYSKAYFCEDEDIAFVRRNEDYDNPESWGCVNMAHQLLVPFEYKRVFDYGRFLIGKNSNGMYLYNKKGQFLYKVGKVRKTEHLAYSKIYCEGDEWGEFRLCIRKMAISKSLYKRLYVMENGLAFLKNEKNLVGVVLFSKLKLSFDYEALSEPQNGYMLAIKKNEHTHKYDCLLIKVRSSIKKEDSIHPTGITLFTNKTWDEVTAYFEEKKLFEKEVNSIVCYNQHVCFSADALNFFPPYIGLPKLPTYEEEEEEKDDYDPWSRENYSYEEAMYDALGGEMEAIWNID